MPDRKYRQKGYQDEGRPERPRGQGPPRERREGPRGRGLGSPTATVIRCATCGKKIEPEEIPFDATCIHCGADLHTCSNCLYFDPAVFNECRQAVPVRIPKKTKRNECTLFSPKLTQEFKKDAPGGAAEARAAFDALFKL
jgi:predicted RNA-binding Zn-ribbon protein involved in translation (DUF1610 family)